MSKEMQEEIQEDKIKDFLQQEEYYNSLKYDKIDDCTEF